jgi:hypothetical protein
MPKSDKFTLGDLVFAKVKLIKCIFILFLEIKAFFRIFSNLIEQEDFSFY